MITGPACLVLLAPIQKRIVVTAKDLGNYITVVPYEESKDNSLLLSEPILLKDNGTFFKLDSVRPAKIARHDNLYQKVRHHDPIIQKALSIACEFFYRAKKKAINANNNKPSDYSEKLFFAIEPKDHLGQDRHFLNPIIREKRNR